MSGGGLRDDWRCRFTLHVEGLKVGFDFGG
jgi:hypothetical protein